MRATSSSRVLIFFLSRSSSFPRSTCVEIVQPDLPYGSAGTIAPCSTGVSQDATCQRMSLSIFGRAGSATAGRQRRKKQQQRGSHALSRAHATAAPQKKIAVLSRAMAIVRCSRSNLCDFKA